MDSIVKQLNRKLMKQDRKKCPLPPKDIQAYKEIAMHYADMENAIAVLSDLSSNLSYIYFGDFARHLGISHGDKNSNINSIWETEILRLVHPDDLKNKYMQELSFFNYMKHLPQNRFKDYYFAGTLRIRNASGTYQQTLHRIFYIPQPAAGGIWLALCLYTPSVVSLPANGLIINSATGETRQTERSNVPKLLSEREVQVIKLIAKGMISKDIAALLSISINTVSRHRQDILRKLQVGNSIEACSVAKEIGII